MAESLNNPSNPVVFFDITIGGQDVGRMKMELFADVVPKTAENFRNNSQKGKCLTQYCFFSDNFVLENTDGVYKMCCDARVQPKNCRTMMSGHGELIRGPQPVKKNNVPIGFKGATFHRVIKDFMIQGGDFIKGDGTGVCSIYGEQPFADENFKLKHDAAGLLSMANSGPNSNGCQFFVTCAKCDFLDTKHVVFGKVVDGLLVMRKIENVPVGPNNRPKLPVVISQCGEM